MNVSVRSYISSGLAAATATVIVIAPVEVQAPAQAVARPVALTAQVQPLQLPAPSALSLPSQLPSLIAQQVSFNAGVAVDFIVTGAELIGQQIQVAQQLGNDIRNGTPIPVALGRAVVGLINIEVVAGHDLVGFGRELVNFQIQFLGNLVSQLPPAISAPAHQALAVTTGAVGTVSGLANGVIDRFAQLTPNVPIAQTHSRQTLSNATPAHPNNVFTLRRDNLKPAAAGGGSTNPMLSNTGNTRHQVTHELRDAVRHTLSGISDHKQHRRDRQGHD
jgi:hypothetical protein